MFWKDHNSLRFGIHKHPPGTVQALQHELMFQHLNLITSCQHLLKAAGWFLSFGWPGAQLEAKAGWKHAVLSAAALPEGCHAPCHHPCASILGMLDVVNTETDSEEKDIEPWAMLPQRGNTLCVSAMMFFNPCAHTTLGKKKIQHFQMVVYMPKSWAKTCLQHSRLWV